MDGWRLRRRLRHSPSYHRLSFYRSFLAVLLLLLLLLLLVHAAARVDTVFVVFLSLSFCAHTHPITLHGRTGRTGGRWTPCRLAEMDLPDLVNNYPLNQLTTTINNLFIWMKHIRLRYGSNKLYQRWRCLGNNKTLTVNKVLDLYCVM